MKTSFLLAFFVLVLTSVFVAADLGPKPSVNFHISLPAGVSDTGVLVRMLHCEPSGFIAQRDDESTRLAVETHLQKYPGVTADQILVHESDQVGLCNWSIDRLAWGGAYANGSALFSYMPPSPFRLLIYVPALKRVFLSEPANRTQFNDAFEATVNAEGKLGLDHDALGATSNPVRLLGFGLSFFLTLLIELTAAFVYFGWIRKNKLSKRNVLLNLGLANVISLPLVWFVFPLFGLDTISTFFLSEAFAVVFEAVFLNHRMPEISLKETLALSLVLNTLSVMIGGLVLVMLGLF